MGALASAVLALLTLSVFARSQLSGPEGALYKYFSAIAQRDGRGVMEFASGSPQDIAYLTSMVYSAFQQRGYYRVVDVVRAGATARAGVIFYFPQGEQPIIVSLIREGTTWKVDAGRTLRPQEMHRP